MKARKEGREQRGRKQRGRVQRGRDQRGRVQRGRSERIGRNMGDYYIYGVDDGVMKDW